MRTRRTSALGERLPTPHVGRRFRRGRAACAERRGLADEVPKRKSPSGFALVARRISSWTTNFVVSALILVAGLSFGRQVLDWWAADEVGLLERPSQLAMTDGLGDPMRAHQLAFGDAPWAVVRETVVGRRDEATAALRARCRDLTISSRLPRGAPGRSERRFLASLGRRTPVAEEPGRWQLHELQGGFPMVVGTQTGLADGRPAEGDQVADRLCRVVTWGLAVPTPERTWALYTFHPAASASGFQTDFPEIALPPNSVRTVVMRAQGGGAIVTFTGASQGEDWSGFFDRSFREHQWRRVGSWTSSGSRWHVRYARAAGHPPQTADVRFGPDARGRLTGLVMISPVTPGDPNSEESER